MSYPLVQNGKMNSMRKAQKIIQPEAILEWGRGGCVGPKKQAETFLLSYECRMMRKGN